MCLKNLDDEDFGDAWLKRVTVRFRSYDSLRVFGAVARFTSVTAAADALNLSKGAVSYQIRKLESELGFELFERVHGRLELTDSGTRLWHVSQAAFEQVDREIGLLRTGPKHTVTAGMLSYFSSRWLSHRLSEFFPSHPGVSLRIEAITSAQMLETTPVDFAVLWGVGGVADQTSELLMRCRAFPVASPAVAAEIESMGLENAMHTLPLLGDSSGHGGWRAWHAAAGLAYKPSPASLTIADSSSRVQAVKDGQGLGLWDALVEPEMSRGELVAVSNVSLDDAGYYLIAPQAVSNQGALQFLDWIREQARSGD